MRLWAADGTGFRLPDEEWLGEEFGWHGNQHNRVPSTRLLAHYDLLNQIVTAVQFHTRYVVENSDRPASTIAQIPKDVCVVYDRGTMLPTLSLSFISITVPIASYGCRLASVILSRHSLPAAKRANRYRKALYKSRMVLNELGISVNAQTTITYRLIRVMLPTGEVEVLLTTLLDTKRFKHGYFSEIYRKRWGIETCFLVIKSFLELVPTFRHTPSIIAGKTFMRILSTTTSKRVLFTAKEREIKKSTNSASTITSPTGTSPLVCSNASSSNSCFARKRTQALDQGFLPPNRSNYGTRQA